MDVSVYARSIGEHVYVTVGEHDTLAVMRRKVADELGIGEDAVKLVLDGEELEDHEEVACYLGSGDAEAVILHERQDAKSILSEAGISVSRDGLETVLSEPAFGCHILTLHEAGVDVFRTSIGVQGLTTLRAIRFNNVDALKGLVSLGVCLDLHSSEPDRFTALHAAARSPNLSCLRYLLSLESIKDVINVKAAKGFTPLHVASSSGTLEAVRLLLEHGANPNSRSDAGMTPLFSATHSKLDTAVAEILLEHDAFLHAKDKEGFTVLHMNCSPAMVDLLVSKGLSPNAASKSGSTPLHAMIKNVAPDRSLLRLVQKGAKLNQKNVKGETPVHFLAARGGWDIRVVVENGGSLTEKDNEGSNPVHVAVKSNGGWVKVWASSLPPEAVNGRDNLGRTPLHYVGTRADAEALVNAGADPAMYDVFGQTPAFRKCCSIRAYLIDNGSPEAHRDVYGMLASQKVSCAEQQRRELSMTWVRRLALDELPAH
eukprot:TRINITY_DN252_c0_g1_i1.p1 TRINITY_DN252_c0_g1~~TRINITY_DN252_c0_g1_i1.p1  ORF type:complete len:485 (+),score=120.83 TRINITY_DN252_c0_g1_i1:125-1579(+)